jgi:hypothetical protein
VPENALLTIVIGFSGVVAIIGIGLVARIVRPARSRRPATPPPHPTSVPAATESAGRSGFALAAFGRTRTQRSVVGNFERAYRRIDAVDPYAGARRIGEALAESGLVAAAPSEREPERPVDTWPFGKARGGRSGEEQK